jgi:hypothetical protein
MLLRRQFLIDLNQLSRLLVFCLLAVSGNGCLTVQKSSRSTQPPAKSPIEVAPASTQPDTMDAAAVNPADVIAHRAQMYSQEMAPALARRDAATPTLAPTPAPAAAVQPSLVQWGDPSATQLSLLPGYLLRSDSTPQAPAAVEASTTSANQAAGQPASMKGETIANGGGVVRAENPGRDADAYHLRAQMASMSSPAGGSETIQENAADAQTEQAPAGGIPDETLHALDAKLSRRVHDYPHDVAAQFDYQLLQFVADQPVPNMSTISSLPDEDREMISAVMDGLSNYRDNLRADNNMLLSRTVRPLLEMADRLRSLADLTIPTLALCQEVRGFGNYTPFDGDPPHFAAGVDHPMILYCEVQNFSSQLNQNKMWQTELVQDAVLYTEGGMSVWNDRSRPINDTARGRRQDFFIVQKMTLPSTLPMGKYLLKVSIEDKQSHHVAEATQPLLIVAQ